MKKRVAQLRPCNRPQYGALSHDMLVDFLNYNLVTFAPSGHSASSAPTSPLLSDRQLTSVKVEIVDFEVQHEQKYPDLNELKSFDGIVITGSFSNAYDNDPWILKFVAFLQDVITNTDIPIVGICFGHQILGRALGGKVRRMHPHPMKKGNNGTMQLEIKQEIREMLGQHADITKLKYIFTHYDEVCELPKGALLVQTAECNPYQSMLVPYNVEKNISRPRMITFQGHPEYLTKSGCISLRLQADMLSAEDKEEFLKSCAEAPLEDTIRLVDLSRYVLFG